MSSKFETVTRIQSNWSEEESHVLTSSDLDQGASDVFAPFYTYIIDDFNLAVCVLGIIGNLVNIVVLTRKNMTTSINFLLAGLAVADLVVLFSNATLVITDKVLIGYRRVSSYSFALRWTYYISYQVSEVSRIISIWLTVVVSVWRFMAVYFPMPTLTWRSFARAKTAVVATCVTCILLTTPSFLLVKIQAIEENGTIYYTLYPSDFTEENPVFAAFYTLWVFRVFLVVFPCTVLAVLTICLVVSVTNKERKSKKLKLTSKNRPGRENKTTKILLAVLFLFLVGNAPQGIFLILAQTATEFDIQFYVLFSQVLTFLVLLHSATNIVVYIVMSTEYRNTLFSLCKQNFC